MEIGVTGFEPATSWSQTRRSTKLSYTPECFVMLITRNAPTHVKVPRGPQRSKFGPSHFSMYSTLAFFRAA
jgi:hypothetical protein